MKYEKANSIASYLDAIPQERKPQLQKLRTLLKKVAPKAKEEFNYGMLYYPLNGALFALASQKHFIALYITYHDLVEQYKPQIGKASFGKSCIRFKKIDDLNMDTIQALIEDSYERRLTEK